MRDTYIYVGFRPDGSQAFARTLEEVELFLVTQQGIDPDEIYHSITGAEEDATGLVKWDGESVRDRNERIRLPGLKTRLESWVRSIVIDVLQNRGLI